MLPSGIAYERDAIELCVSRLPDQDSVVTRPGGTKTTMNLYFSHLPFVFNQSGKTPGHDYMHAHYYISWISSVTGIIPQTRTKGKSPNSSPSEESSDAFAEIIEMLRETKSDPTMDETESLRMELNDAQNKPAAAKNTVEKEQAAMQGSHQRVLATEKRKIDAMVQGARLEQFDLEKALEDEMTRSSATPTTQKILQNERSNNRDGYCREIAQANNAQARANGAEKKLGSRGRELDAEKKRTQVLTTGLMTAKNFCHGREQDGFGC
jgi:hypothetical protein